ncbi:LHFPL tetraspan subfamily member 2a protein [Euwallacea fornicatus]|uniref:LHFPL tetraspan subfamily member 2a protein n=1 Tax=Euwallacea fornicatus TaxID=995702 RepID=UPI00338F547F
MGYVIVTARSIVWMLLNLVCNLMALYAILSPSWISAAPQLATFSNHTVKYTPSLGLYSKCSRPIWWDQHVCAAMDSVGPFARSPMYPGPWKATSVFLTLGLFLLSITGSSSILSCCQQSVFKKSIFIVSGVAQCVAGIFLILAMMLYPMAWGSRTVRELCGKDSSPFYLGDCALGPGLYMGAGGTALTFVCSYLSMPAEKSTSSDKVQDKIYEGQRLICLS